MSLLGDAAIAAAIERLQGWARDGNTIRAEYRFRDFSEAVAFVNRVAEAANRADHHPDICVRYNRVELTLATHSAGGITEKDLAMAEACDRAA